MADGTLKVGTITTSSGSGTITLGQSGETVNIPSGVTVSGASANTPAFEAKRSANQTASAGAFTKMELNTVLYNTGDYDNSTYKFTPTVAGKYYVYINAYHNPSSTANLYDYAVAIYKNGSEADGAAEFLIDTEGTTGITEVAAQTGVRVIDMNGTTDYLEFYFYQTVSGGTPTISSRSFAGAYRLIGA